MTEAYPTDSSRDGGLQQSTEISRTARLQRAMASCYFPPTTIAEHEEALMSTETGTSVSATRAYDSASIHLIILSKGLYNSIE